MLREPDPPVMLDASAVAAHLGVDLETVQGWIAARRWPDGHVLHALGPAGEPGRAKVFRWDFDQFESRKRAQV